MMGGALKRHAGRLRRWLFVGLACLLGVAVVLALSISGYADHRSDTDADAAIVLGAAVSDRVPSPVFEERLRHARDLYRDGRVGLIVVTGGRGPGDTLSEGEAGRDWLIRQGVPSADILAETRSRTTIQNLAFARPLLEARGVETILLVSDPLHMRRATLVAARQGLDVAPSPTPTTRYRTWRTQGPFLLREVWFLAQFLVTGH